MPKYQEIAGWLEQGICDGRYLSGQKLPSEQALREQFGVSRQTVRRALEVLEDEGLVYGRQGSGPFVADQEAEENAKSRLSIHWISRRLFLGPKSCVYVL